MKALCIALNGHSVCRAGGASDLVTCSFSAIPHNGYIELRVFGFVSATNSQVEKLLVWAHQCLTIDDVVDIQLSETYELDTPGHLLSKFSPHPEVFQTVTIELLRDGREILCSTAVPGEFLTVDILLRSTGSCRLLANAGRLGGGGDKGLLDIIVDQNQCLRVQFQKHSRLE